MNNRRQRLADLSIRIFAEAVALFDPDKGMSFAEARRLAAQKLATSERLKPRAPTTKHTTPRPDISIDNSDHPNAKEILFQKIFGIKARQEASPTIGGRIRRYIFNEAKEQHSESKEPSASSEATPVETAPSTFGMQVYSGGSFGPELIPDDEYPVGMCDRTTANWRKSLNAHRKPLLVQQTRKYSEADILKMVHDNEATEKATIDKGRNQMDTDDFDDEVLTKVQAGDYDGAEQYLDEAIAKFSDQLAKAKKQPPPAPTTDDGPENDNNWNATGEDELDQDEVPPVKAKKSADDVEESIAKIRAMDAMESEVDRIHEISKIADAFNAGPIRKRAIAATLDAMEREVDRVAKLGGGGTYAPFNNRVSYPHGQGETVLQSNRTVSPGSSTTFPDRSQRRVTPVVQNVGRHQFDNLVDATRARDGGSRLKAFTTARLENPGVYESYQNWHSGNTTQEQRSVQQETNNPVNKSAPTTSYDDLVNVEIRKGHSPRVAQQRVAQLYGLLPDETIAKAEDNYQQLKDVAQGLLDEGDSMPRTSALRKARLSNEGLYKRLNAI